ncbi:MAG TPA: hypothetical protein VK886_12175 [Vicinamibacterales bacterium]|nr:hypothetical protein [Vicinamibacterales bacterium]
MRTPFVSLTVAALALVAPLSSALQSPTIRVQQSGTTNRLQAISPVTPRIAWASGLGGTFAVTTDGGDTWRSGVVAGAETLQFRDVHGVNERVAYLLSSGTGTASRIYKTADGGQTWTLQFQNTDPNGFYDCFAFWAPTRGVTMADSVEGRFPVVRTTNGRDWENIGDRLPPAQAGEAAFAASGTCATTQGGQRAWLATGAAERARILATTDGGDTWAAYDLPIVDGTPTSGAFSVDFRDAFHGIVGGGELAAPDAFLENVARTSDGGRTWQLASSPTFPGAIYGLTYVRGRRTTVVATGPGGVAWSPDEGNTWTPLPGLTGFWAVAFASPQAGWLVGTDGRIVRLSF